MTPHDSPPRNGLKGGVSIARTVWCADCANWQMATENATLKQAHREWKCSGWVHTAKLGWVCPTCWSERTAPHPG